MRKIFIFLALATTSSSYSVVKTPKKGIDIQKVMNYQMPDIVQRYQKDFNVSSETAKIHERELKRYLILAAENSPEPTSMFSKDIDNLWHTFLLFTREYDAFCKEMFGKFIHHAPKTHK